MTAKGCAEARSRADGVFEFVALAIRSAYGQPTISTSAGTCDDLPSLIANALVRELTSSGRMSNLSDDDVEAFRMHAASGAALALELLRPGNLPARSTS